MAQVVGGGQVRKNDGSVVAAQQGGWYDGQQYWNGSLSQPGVIHNDSNQVGAGKAVSAEVLRQTSIAAGKAPDANQTYINQQRQQQGLGVLDSPTSMSTWGDAGGGGGGGGFATPDVINLPNIYEQLYKDSGIKDIEDKYSTMEKQFIETKGQINDNPFLSEGTRVGRVAKLEQLFGERTASLKNDIATKKADIEMKVNLQTKQFDINSQAAEQALNRFNVLLQSGALNGASGDDIASITRATGLSSGMIQGAIAAKKKADTKTEMISFDDGTNQGFVMVDGDGNILSRQVVAASKPSSSGGGAMSESKQFDLDKKFAPQYAAEDARNRMTLGTMMKTYLPYLDKQTIFDLYMTNNVYNPNKKQIAADKKKYGVK